MKSDNNNNNNNNHHDSSSSSTSQRLPTRNIAFCNVAIELITNDQNEQLVALVMRKALVTNITMLTNVSSNHAGPVYLKDLADDLYYSLGSYNSDNNDNNIDISSNDIESKDSHSHSYSHSHSPIDASSVSSDQSAPTPTVKSQSPLLSQAPPYELYSHPLPGINYSSPAYAERGSLGASILLLYCIITTISCVQHIIHLRAVGFKLQLHLSGMTVVAYWLGNFLCDVCIVILPLLAAYCGKDLCIVIL